MIYCKLADILPICLYQSDYYKNIEQKLENMPGVIILSAKQFGEQLKGKEI